MNHRASWPRCVLAVVLSTAPVAAQSAGDLLIADSTNTQIHVVAPLAPAPTTSIPLPSGSTRGIAVAADNQTLYAASGLAVYAIRSGAVVTTIAATLPLGVNTTWADLDEDGHLLIGTGYSGAGAVFRVDASTGTAFATIRPNSFPNAFVLDRDTGDVAIGDITARTVFRATRAGVVTTAATISGSIYAMEFHRESNGLLVGTFTDILHVDPSGSVTTFVAGSGYVKSLAVLPDGTVAYGENRVSTITRVSATGTPINQIYTGANLNNTAMAVFDERNVWGLNAPVVGTTFALNVRFDGHAGKSYVAAASLSTRPGIPVDTRTIPLTPDSIFAATFALPQVFVNFAGTLNANATARPSIVLPPIGALSGIRIYVAAVVFDPAAPSGVAAISQQYGATIN